MHPHLRKQSKIPTRPPPPHQIACCWGKFALQLEGSAMESLFRRTTATGGGFDALKRLGHISPAVQSHLKHTGPLPRRLLFLCFDAISLATAILIACLPHPDLRVGLLRARRLPPHHPQRRRHPHHCRMPGRHRLPHLPPRIPAPGEEPLRLAHVRRASTRGLRRPAPRSSPSLGPEDPSHDLRRDSDCFRMLSRLLPSSPRAGSTNTWAAWSPLPSPFFSG